MEIKVNFLVNVGGNVGGSREGGCGSGVAVVVVVVALELMTGAHRREQRSSHNIRHFKNVNHAKEAFISLEISSNRENAFSNIII